MLLLTDWERKIRLRRYRTYPRCCIYFSSERSLYKQLFDMKSPMAKIGGRYDLINFASKIRTLLVMVATRTQLPSYVGQDENNRLLSIHGIMERPHP